MYIDHKGCIQNTEQKTQGVNRIQNTGYVQNMEWHNHNP